MKYEYYFSYYFKTLANKEAIIEFIKDDINNNPIYKDKFDFTKYGDKCICHICNDGSLEGVGITSSIQYISAHFTVEGKEYLDIVYMVDMGSVKKHFKLEDIKYIEHIHTTDYFMTKIIEQSIGEYVVDKI